MSSNKAKLLHFIKLASSTFMIQGLIQFIGMVIGFYIVRQLSVQEYAYYTVANTVLGMMAVLCDCGINAGVYSQGSLVWRDRVKLGSVVNTGIQIRKQLALFVIIISIPILSYMLHKQGAEWWTIVLISLAMIPAFKATITDSLYEIVPKLHQELRPLQSNQFSVAVLRLLLTGILLIIFPVTWITVLANGIPRIYGNFKLRKIVFKKADLLQLENIDVRQKMFRIVRKVMPGTVYYAFSGQISLFILVNMGKVSDTAAWGALGRFAIILTIFQMVINILLIPRYIRSSSIYKVLLMNGHKIILIGILVSGLVLLFSNIFSGFLVGLLGENYRGLDFELILVLMSSCLILISNICRSLYFEKGWIISPFIELLINIFPLIFLVLFLEINSLQDVLLFNLGVAFYTFIYSYVVYNVQIYRYTIKS